MLMKEKFPIINCLLQYLGNTVASRVVYLYIHTHNQSKYMNKKCAHSNLKIRLKQPPETPPKFKSIYVYCLKAFDKTNKNKFA